MSEIIAKELISHLVKLGSEQQEQVLSYVKEILVEQEMNRRATMSEEEIKNGLVIDLHDFDTEFQEWKKSRQHTIR